MIKLPQNLKALGIRGIGFAAAKTKISNQVLAKLNPDFLRAQFESDSSFEGNSGVECRYSALSENYLDETRNADITQAFANLAENDLELAGRAIAQALSRSGLELSQIGLIIGETSTPFQTIPSQAQRIAGSLGLKIKSYDILAGAASPSLHLANLDSWRTERLPEYILLVYSNLPTVFIDYSSVSANTARFSDAVAAVVICTKEKGALSVLSVSSKSEVSKASAEIVAMDRPLMISSATERLIESQLAIVAADALKACPRGARKNYFVTSQVSPKVIYRLGKDSGFAADEIMISTYGDSFSSGPFGPLSDNWDRLCSGDRVYMNFCGLGLQYGHIVLEVNGSGGQVND